MLGVTTVNLAIFISFIFYFRHIKQVNYFMIVRCFLIINVIEYQTDSEEWSTPWRHKTGFRGRLALSTSGRSSPLLAQGRAAGWHQTYATVTRPPLRARGRRRTYAPYRVHNIFLPPPLYLKLWESYTNLMSSPLTLGFVLQWEIDSSNSPKKIRAKLTWVTP